MHREKSRSMLNDSNAELTAIIEAIEETSKLKYEAESSIFKLTYDYKFLESFKQNPDYELIDQL